MGAKMNLNLDKPNGIDATIVFHSVHYKGMRFRITTGDLIAPKHWDKETQLVKRTRANFNSFNSKFREQQNTIEKVIINLERSYKKVTKETVGTQLPWLSETNSIKLGTNILTVYNIFVSKYCANKEMATRRHYNTTLTRLDGYEKKIGKTLTFFDLDKDFCNSFSSYLLKDVGLFDNSTGNHIKHLKVFLKWANEEAYTDSVIYSKWKVTKEDGKDVFFLKYHEIQLIENTLFEPRLEKVKDLFLISCYTGLRYSDIATLKQSDEHENILTKVTGKTGEKVEIPIIPDLKKILQKYWGHNIQLPKISNQKGNNYIKEIIKKAGISRSFTYVQKRNRKAIEEIYKAWEMCSWHTGRHSFITNSIQFGINPDVVRRIVGHKSFNTMSRYIQHDINFSKNEMMKYNMESDKN